MTALVSIMADTITHLTVFDLAAPVAVEVVSYSPEPVVVQLAGDDLGRMAALLLAWADTLHAVSASAWRPSVRSVHLDVTGSLPSGHRVKVYGAVPHSAAVFGDLQRDGRTSVSLGVLREWASSGEVAA